VPGNIRDGKKVPKGYRLSQFADAFRRYLGALGASEPLHRYTPTAAGVSTAFQTATPEANVAVQKREKTLHPNDCSGVAVRKGVTAPGRASDVCVNWAGLTVKLLR
jgi:hypothetical protein